MRALLYRIYGLFTALVTPGLRNSQFAYAECLERIAPGRRGWLDVGCGHQMIPSWLHWDPARLDALRNGNDALIGIDLDLPSLRKNTSCDHVTYGSIDRLPFADASFDLITANMVAEHLAHPEQALAEVARVLRPGGLFAFHTPNHRSPLVRLSGWMPQAPKNLLIRLLEGRDEDDVFPTVYRLNTEGDIRALAEEAGLGVRELTHLETTASTLVLGPFVVFELLWIRRLRRESRRHLRTNLVVVLEKPSAG